MGTDGVSDRGTLDAGATLEEVLSLPWSSAIRGASGLARGPDGQLFAALERAEGLLVFRTAPVLGGSSPPAGLRSLRTDPPSVERWPIEGVPDLDLEALALVPTTSGAPPRLVFGTEAHRARTEDLLVFARLEPGRAIVTSTERVDYASVQVEVESNQGIEALCASGPDLLLFIETPIEREGHRLAPVLRYRPGRGILGKYELELSTQTGKIADVDCRLAADGSTAVRAIERHYGVSRIIGLVVPAGPAERPLVPTLLVNLAPRLSRPPPNLEGLTWDRDGFWLLSDNDPPSTQGLKPTLLFRVHLRPLP